VVRYALRLPPHSSLQYRDHFGAISIGQPVHDGRKRIQYYGPYITLLTDLFPHVQHFQVAPQFKGPFTPGSVDFTVIYIVTKRKVPVFFIEVKPYVHLQSPGKRGDADEQMRRRFRDLVVGSSPIPKLYGVSAMGTCLSIYEYMICWKPLERKSSERQ